jgi:hypothetical protein
LDTEKEHLKQYPGVTHNKIPCESIKSYQADPNKHDEEVVVHPNLTGFRQDVEPNPQKHAPRLKPASRRLKGILVDHYDGEQRTAIPQIIATTMEKYEMLNWYL